MRLEQLDGLPGFGRRQTPVSFAAQDADARRPYTRSYRSARAAELEEVLVRQDGAVGDEPQPRAARIAQELRTRDAPLRRRALLGVLVPIHVDHASAATQA